MRKISFGTVALGRGTGNVSGCSKDSWGSRAGQQSDGHREHVISRTVGATGIYYGDLMGFLLKLVRDKYITGRGWAVCQVSGRWLLTLLVSGLCSNPGQCKARRCKMDLEGRRVCPGEKLFRRTLLYCSQGKSESELKPECLGFFGGHITICPHG